MIKCEGIFTSWRHTPTVAKIYDDIIDVMMSVNSNFIFPRNQSQTQKVLQCANFPLHSWTAYPGHLRLFGQPLNWDLLGGYRKPSDLRMPLEHKIQKWVKKVAISTFLGVFGGSHNRWKHKNLKIPKKMGTCRSETSLFRGFWGCGPKW